MPGIQGRNAPRAIDGFRQDPGTPAPRDRPGGAPAAPCAASRRRHALVLLACLASACSLAEGDVEPPARKRPANRLGRETSPYLLAHAHNPVDWYPWGPEALEKARQEDKPIFLSIGYSSCHWCHVMEKKVFSDPEIARFMNEHFINIKVDREERPDLDDVYMTALSVYFELIRSPQTGGWPLSLFLTPDGRPLGGGTYFPPDDQEGQMGFPTLLANLSDAWSDPQKRKQLETNADILARAVRASLRPRPALRAAPLDDALLAPVERALAATYDPEYGGFGFNPRNPRRPKFPVPVKLGFLLNQARRQGNDAAGRMLYHTLDAMAAGGIYDHVGGGFHRYSTDRAWRVPHFEKMLYDNAQLIDLYAEAYRGTRNRLYRAVVEETVEFVFRELTDTGGAFYAALDADSEGVEGKYYAWTEEQLGQVLADDDLRVCRTVFGLDEPAEFEHGHVLFLPRALDQVATELGATPMQLRRQVDRVKRLLLAARQKRRPPARDEKILASWNGLMIRALSRAGVILEKPEYIEAAGRAAEFVLSQMRDDQGRIQRTWCAGRAHLAGYLDDYAHLIDGLLALHLATQDDKWLNAARRLNDLQLSQFWDEQGHGCYFTGSHHEELLARVKSAYDSVLPSGNSVTVRNLLRLAALVEEPEYRRKARQALELFAPVLQESPAGLAHLALALAEYLETTPAGGPTSSRRERGSGIGPDAAVVLAGAEQAQAEQPTAKAPHKNKYNDSMLAGKAYLSVNRLPPGGTCRLLVELEVAKGWMIHANPAGDDELDVATEVTLESRQGVVLKKVDYPKGTLLDREEDGPPKCVYRGKVRLLGTLEVPAGAAGKRDELLVRVRYQACNQHKCLLPKTLELPLDCAVARRLDEVSPANEALFAAPRAKPR